ncbi:MAG: hypothetical protein RLZZ16_173 [Actinomycetota bacterium]
MAEWQTRRTQNPLFERACGFKSHLGHQMETPTVTDVFGTRLIERRLRTVSQSLAAMRAELVICDEQLAHFEDDANDKEIRALVSETASAAHEHRDAARHLEFVRRRRAELMEDIRELEVRQDELLDGLNKKSGSR